MSETTLSPERKSFKVDSCTHTEHVYKPLNSEARLLPPSLIGRDDIHVFSKTASFFKLIDSIIIPFIWVLKLLISQRQTYTNPQQMEVLGSMFPALLLGL